MNRSFYRVLIYSLLWVVFFYLLSPVIPTYGDDMVNQGALNDKHFFEWIVGLYHFWTGRLILSSLLVGLLNTSILIWRALNAFMLTLLVYAIVEHVDGKLFSAILASLLILVLPISILNSSAFWITGSLNYLWPTSALVALLSLLRRFYKQEFVSNIQYIGAIILTIFASNMEQTALVLIVFYAIIIVYVYIMSKRFDQRMISLWIFMVVGFIFTLFAPGNYYRFNAEVLGLNPSFVMLDGFDKMMIGLRYTFDVLFDELKVYMWVLNVCILLISMRNKKNILLALVPLTILSFKGAFDLFLRFNPYCRGCNDLHYILFNHQYFETYYFVEFIHLIPIVIAAIYVIFTVVSIFSSQTSLEMPIFNSLIIVSGLSSAIILGFSPTINASGHRIFFVLAIHLVLLLVFYITQLFSYINELWLKRLIVSLGILYLLRIAYTFATVSEFLVIY